MYKLAPSLLAADFGIIKEQLAKLDEAKVPYLHLDIMDGVFVPNLMLSNTFIKAVRSVTDLPLDMHLMIVQPENKIHWFDIRKGDYVSIHYESTSNVLGTLQMIEEAGGNPGVALSPATPVESLSYLLENLKLVNIMAVNPGFAGRAMVPMTLKKIADTRKFLDSHGRENTVLEVDGNVTFEHARLMRDAGADMFVGGSSGLFLDEYPIGVAAKKLYDCIK